MSIRQLNYPQYFQTISVYRTEVLELCYDEHGSIEIAYKSLEFALPEEGTQHCRFMSFFLQDYDMS